VFTALLFSTVALLGATGGSQDVHFQDVADEYHSFAEIVPVVVADAARPVYLMSYFPRYAAFLQRWDDQLGRWEDGERPITCATISDADVPIRLEAGKRVQLATYWQWAVEQRDELVFKVGAYASRPAAGTYRLVLEYAAEPWALGKAPNQVLYAYSPSFHIKP
jgi:hypothetical protein